MARDKRTIFQDWVNEAVRTTARKLGLTNPDTRQQNIIHIIAAGGTFLCSYLDTVQSPIKHKNLFEFIAASNLAPQFTAKGLYEESGRYFLKDGTEIKYTPLEPAIDSTNATYKNRLEVLNAIQNSRRENGATGYLVIHGTDTAAEMAQMLDMHFGRNNNFGIAIVTSQKPADDPKSDGPGQFNTAFEALQGRKFKQVFVLSDAGKAIFNAIVAKISDISGKIFGSGEKGPIAVNDLGIQYLRQPSDPGTTLSQELPVALEVSDYKNMTIFPFSPTFGGNQDLQALAAADIIEYAVGGKSKIPYTGLAISLAGSGNIPTYAHEVLKATQNAIPIIAISSVPGAVGSSHYAVAVSGVAQEYKLANVIVLPASRPGPDSRPEFIMGYAAKYAEPLTPEYLMFCHLFSAMAWTEEDEPAIAVKGSPINGSRAQLCELIQTLEKETALTRKQLNCTYDQNKIALSRALLSNRIVQENFGLYVPHIEFAEGKVRYKNEQPIAESALTSDDVTPMPDLQVAAQTETTVDASSDGKQPKRDVIDNRLASEVVTAPISMPRALALAEASAIIRRTTPVLRVIETYQADMLNFGSEENREAARRVEDFARQGRLPYELWLNDVPTEGASSAEAARIRTVDGLRGIPSCYELTTSLLVLEKGGQEHYILACCNSMHRYDAERLQRQLGGTVRRAENVAMYGLINPFMTEVNGKPIHAIIFDYSVTHFDTKMYTNAGTAEATIEFSPKRYCNSLGSLVRGPDNKLLIHDCDFIERSSDFRVLRNESVGVIGGPPAAASGDVARVIEEKFASMFIELDPKKDVQVLKAGEVPDPKKVVQILEAGDAAASLVRAVRPHISMSIIAGADRTAHNGRVPQDIIEKIIAEIDLMIQRGSKTFVLADNYLSAAASQIRAAFKDKPMSHAMDFVFPPEVVGEYFQNVPAKNIVLLAPQFVIDSAYRDFVATHKPLLLTGEEQQKLEAIRLQITASGRDMFADASMRRSIQDSYNAIIKDVTKRFDNGEPVYIIQGVSQLGVLNYYPTRGEPKPIIINPLELSAQRAAELTFIKTFQTFPSNYEAPQPLSERLAFTLDLMKAYLSRKAQKAFREKYGPPQFGRGLTARASALQRPSAW